MPAAGQTESAPARRLKRELHTGPVAVLISLVIVAVVLFVITTLYSRAYRRMQDANSRRWFDRGQSELHAGNPRQAAVSFRNALSFRRNREYLFQLAQALVAAGDYQEARGYLLYLWDQQPGKGELNLALARLEATTGTPTLAVRYYQNAIYGAWDSDPDQHRREVRFELADFLLRHKDRANAESDLIALTTDLPRDYSSTLRIAQLFYATGDLDRALRYYETAAKLAPSSSDALAGAGNTAFELGNYTLARQYLARVSKTQASNDNVSQKLRVAGEVLRLDPLQRSLSGRERSRRIVQAWKQAISTISSCAQQNGLDVAHNTGPQSRLMSAYSDLAALKPEMSEHKLFGETNALEDVLSRISAAENASAAVCGQLSPADLALQLIAKTHGAASQ